MDVAVSPGRLEPFWHGSIDERLAAFAAMRERSGGIEQHVDDHGKPFWSVTSHAALGEVSRNPGTFTSTLGFSLDDFPKEVLDVMASIIVLDDPRHQQQRRIVQHAFSPAAIRRLTTSVEAIADGIVEKLRDLPDFDFVTEVGGNLPLQVICDLLDVPADDRPQLRDWINAILGVDDPEFGGPAESLRCLLALHAYAVHLGEQRLRRPGDDIITVLMHAEVDGVRLTPAELGSFVVLLVSAGNDTTRTALTWAVHLFSEHPDQQAALAADFEGLHANAVDEVLRWCSPALHMRRTATEDATVAGQPIAAGDKVVLWFLAANHDPAVFADPHAFDLRRSNARDQIAFGAGGPHFCLGSHLAKMELRVVLGRLLEAFPLLHATAPPDLLRSPFVHTIKSLPCATR